jgi:ABC-2 type transport system permease protein
MRPSRMLLLGLAGLVAIHVFMLAGRIAASQGREVTLMQGWLQAWGKPAAPHMDHGGMHMPGPVEAATDVLPGTAAGSLAGALGALTQDDPNGTPGVVTAIGGTAAVALLGAYLLAFVVASLALKARRDVTS